MGDWRRGTSLGGGGGRTVSAEAVNDNGARRARTRPRVEVGDDLGGRYAQRDARRDALLCRLRGTEPEGAARTYARCSLATIQKLEAIAAGLPLGVGLASSGTSDYAWILGDVLRQRVGDFVRVANPVARRLCRPYELRDFRETRLAIPEVPELRRVAEHGAIRVGVFGESGEPILLLTFGTILELTYAAVVADDIGALDDIARAFAQAALAAEDDLFFASLLLASGAGPTLRDGIALFDGAHSNLLAGGALDAAALGAAIAALRKQKSAAGKNLNLMPRFALVEPDVEATARALVRDISTDGSAALEVVTAAQLDGNGFYLLADPRITAGYGIAYLAGARTPTVASAPSFESDGVGFKCMFDVGIAPINFRAVNRTPAS
jgi:hypothetical protein